MTPRSHLGQSYVKNVCLCPGWRPKVHFGQIEGVAWWIKHFVHLHFRQVEEVEAEVAAEAVAQLLTVEEAAVEAEAAGQLLTVEEAAAAVEAEAEKIQVCD